MALTGGFVSTPEDQQLLELLLGASTDGVMDWDIVRNSIRYTDRWKLLLGYEPLPLKDSPTLWSELSHPDDLPRVRELLEDHLENFWPFSHTWRMRHDNGEWRWVLCRAVTARDMEGRPLRLVAVFSDITDRVQIEERLRALTAAIPDLLLRLRGDGTIVDVKAPDGRAPAGVTWPEPGQSLSRWKPAAEWHERLLSYVQGSRSSSRVRLIEVTLVGARPRRQVEIRVVPSGDNEAVCIVRDVTEQRQLQAQVQQGQKLESIGQLAAGIAHEINTPMQYIGDNLTFAQEAFIDLLTMIDGYDQAVLAPEATLAAPTRAKLDALREAQDLDYIRQKAPAAMSAALEGVSRVSRIVNAMKEFSHPGKTEKTLADINREIETTITVATHVWKDVADLERVLDPTLPRVLCHPSEFNQVILNLIVNAAHAIGDVIAKGEGTRGMIKISTTVQGDHVEVRISDTGGGIPEPVRDRIFDPFFTTKEVGRGTGQGLAIARSTVVDKHGGTIHFETETGRGTTFIVRLPLAPAAA